MPPSNQPNDPTAHDKPADTKLPEADSADLGGGYRSARPRTFAQVPKPEIKRLDPTTKWLDRPSVENQISKDGAWKKDKMLVEVFEIPRELDRYNAFLHECNRPDTNQYVVNRDKQFVQSTSSWQIMVEYQTVLFKEIFNPGSPR